MYLSSINLKNTTAQSFAGKGKFAKLRELVSPIKTAQKDEFAPHIVSVEAMKAKIAKEAEVTLIPQNIVKKNEAGSIEYLRVFDQSRLEGQKIEGTADIGGGTFHNSSAKSLNVYGNAKVKNSSGIEGTYVGEKATLEGGEHGHFNIQGEGQVSKAKANYATLFWKGKLSDSTIAQEVEVNDFATIQNVKADKIIMNGWFSSLKGKNNECKELRADFVWRLLHLDFRKEIKPSKNS